MDWIHRIRMKALALVLGLALVAIALVSLTAVSAWPVVGVAAVAAAVAVNSMASKLRLEHPMCVHCNQDLSGETPGVYGIVCPNCGTIDASLAQAGDAPGTIDDDVLADADELASDDEHA